MYRYEIKHEVRTDNAPKEIKLYVRITKVDENEPIGVIGNYVGSLVQEIHAPNWFEKLFKVTLSDKFNDALRNLTAHAKKLVDDNIEADMLKIKYDQVIKRFNNKEYHDREDIA